MTVPPLPAGAMPAAALRARLEVIVGGRRVLDSPAERIAHAHDASFYRLVPQAIAFAASEPEVAQLFELSHELGVPIAETEVVLTGIHVPNTLSVSPNGRRMYLADSRLQTLFVHDMADLSKIQEFAHTRGAPATPDGSAVDAQGYLWNCQWDGWRIVRYAPDGRIERIIQMPVQRPTSCAFGGPDLTTLYVTSASTASHRWP